MFTRRKFIQSAGIASLAGGLTLLTPEAVRAATRALTIARQLDLYGATVVAAFPAGAGFDQIGIRAAAGVSSGGPQSLAVLTDGRIAILDTLNRRISFVRGSSISSTTPLPEAVYPLDCQPAGADLMVADTAGRKLYRVRNDTVTFETISEDARDNGISRLAAGPGGDVVVIEEDTRSYRQSVGRGDIGEGFVDPQGGRATVAYSQNSHVNRRSAELRLSGGGSYTISVNGDLGSVIYLGDDALARQYFQVTELVQSDDGIDPDLTVRRFTRDGQPAGTARVPVRGRHSDPRRAVAIAPSGEAYAIVPRADSVLLVKLIWADALPTLQPIRTISLGLGNFSANAATNVPVCRAAAIATANQYAHANWIALSQNLRALDSTWLPTYFGGPGGYTNLPYNWGGFDTYAQFISRMNNGDRAGNWNYNLAPHPGTAGTDCSGYIQNCWSDTATKMNDTDLYNRYIWQAGPSSQGATLGDGDMWRIAGVHVRMHHYYPVSGTGDYMYESSLDWGQATYHEFRPWADYSSYYWNKAQFTC